MGTIHISNGDSKWTVSLDIGIGAKSNDTRSVVVASLWPPACLRSEAADESHWEAGTRQNMLSRYRTRSCSLAGRNRLCRLHRERSSFFRSTGRYLLMQEPILHQTQPLDAPHTGCMFLPDESMHRLLVVQRTWGIYSGFSGHTCTCITYSREGNA